MPSKNKVADEKSWSKVANIHQQAEFFFTKKIRQMKAGQNNKYDNIAKASGLVQICGGSNSSLVCPQHAVTSQE